MSRSANFYRLLSVMLVGGVLLAVLMWALAMRSDVVKTESVFGQVEKITETGGQPMLHLQVSEERLVRLILPFGQPVPEVGERLPLFVEYYDDGEIRYRWLTKP